MKKSLIRSLTLLIASAAFIFLGQSFSVNGKDPAINRPGISDAQAMMVDSNLLVYGIAQGGSLRAELFDPKLNTKFSFTSNFPDFVGATVTLDQFSNNYYDFVITSSRSSSRYVRLNAKLEQVYASDSYVLVDPGNTIEHKMSELQTDTSYCYVQTDLGQDSAKKLKPITEVVFGKNSLDKLPHRVESWKKKLSDGAADYARVISIRNGLVYVYVNKSVQEGQFIYCFDEKDGREVYKTRLRVIASDFHRDSWHPDEVFAGSNECIFSNFLWDARTGKLTIAGTWQGSISAPGWTNLNNTGLFLMQLNADGSINACDADYDYWLHTNTTGGQHRGDGFFSRNRNTYYRITDLAYEPDGTFSLYVEIYAQIMLWSPEKVGQKEFHYLQDSSYHYFTTQKQIYSMLAGSIRPKCTECIVRTVPWEANHHLDSIKGFVPGKTKIYDEQYPDNINLLCDASRADGHFVAGLRTLKGKNGTKVLTRVPVDVNGQVKSAYFTKTLYVPNANWMAFLSPDPIKGQDFSRPAEYFAANSEWLYRLEIVSNGYQLSMVRW